MLFIIPERSVTKDIYKIILLNRKPILKSKAYWENRLHDDDIAWDTWFKQNLCNNLMPRKCKDVNWKLFHGQIKTENRLCKMQYSDGSCYVCSNVVENVEHLLTTCSAHDEIWNVTEYIIKNHIDSVLPSHILTRWLDTLK